MHQTARASKDTPRAAGDGQALAGQSRLALVPFQRWPDDNMARVNRTRGRVFVASSTKHRPLAYAIQQNLDDYADVTVWDQNVFHLNKSALESLLKQLERSDFAVFVFAPDDIVKLGRATVKAVRDNVVFELGFFMGRLGRTRTFIVAPKGQTNLHLPTDLLGITVGRFNASRQDDNVRGALGPFCNDVRAQLRKFPSAKRPTEKSSKRRTIRARGGLRILEALYGARDHRVNVAHKLNSLVERGRLHVYMGNQLAGDPCPGTVKDVLVRYLHKGVEKSLRRPGPPLADLGCLPRPHRHRRGPAASLRNPRSATARTARTCGHKAPVHEATERARAIWLYALGQP